MGSTLFWLLLPHSIMDVWKGWFTFYFAGSNKNYQSMSIRSRNHTGFCPNKTYKMQLNHPWDEITKHMWQLFFGRYVYRIYRGDFTPFIAGSPPHLAMEQLPVQLLDRLDLLSRDMRTEMRSMSSRRFVGRFGRFGGWSMLQLFGVWGGVAGDDHVSWTCQHGRCYARSWVGWGGVNKMQTA